MAYKNKQIRNPVTGQSIRFLQTSADTEGELLEMETVYLPGSTQPPAHYHPKQTETFVVMNGSVHVRMRGRTWRLQAGDVLVIPPRTVHSMWNPSNESAVVNWKVTPALATEYLLETAAALAAKGRVNHRGQPSLLQSALLLRKYRKVYRMGSLPYWLQQTLVAAVTPLSKLAGYKAVYNEFLD